MALKEPEILQIENWQVQIKRSTRRRTLALEIDANGITARAPNRMRLSSIQDFVLAKSNWIEKHLKNRKPVPPPIELENGATVCLLGKPYTLNICRGRGAISIENESAIRVPVIDSNLPVEERIRRKLVKWYKQVAIEYLIDTAKSQALQMFPHQPKLNHIADQDIKVREYKRRWGSCNHCGELAFNWRIIMAPPSVIEYVVVHELAHRKEFNHSPQFWRLVESQIPDWQLNREWLNLNGHSLHVF